MDNHDAVNLGDEDIVKDTQWFFPDDCNGSQVQCDAEPRFLYALSQAGAYSHTPYGPYPSMRTPAVHVSQDRRCPSIPQISYGQQHAWPNYGFGYGSAVHSMQQLVGSGMYPSFATSNFAAMPPSFMGPHGGVVGNVVPSPAVHEVLQTPAVRTDSARTLDPNPLSTRHPVSSMGPWVNPRSKRGEEEKERQQSTIMKNLVSISRPSTSACEDNKTNSAETEEEAVRVKNVAAQKDQKDEWCLRTPSQTAYGLQGAFKNSSKSKPSQFLTPRRAMREEEKLYSKEVRKAILDGRVPQVTVGQDENGNIIRYKSQFLQALKLAAHAVVQDAYIKVNEQESMNQIMQEVKRQFVLHEPLPSGMVEGYLKSYYKRCRSKYHQHWIEHGDLEKPDDCKQAAWLQLIEFWKSPEGKKECQKNSENRMNASAEKSNSKRKHKEDVDTVYSVAEVAEVEATGSPEDQSGNSDSLGFDFMKTTKPSASARRNPMADISNQLHDAVDTILASYAASCYSKPPTNNETDDGRPPLHAHGSQNLKNGKGSTRSVAEVLGSLQWPQVLDSKNGEVTGDLKTKCNVFNTVGVAKEDAVHLLSSDALSDGENAALIRRAKTIRSEDVVRGKQQRVESEEVLRMSHSKSQYLEQSKKKLFVEEEKPVTCHKRQESIKGISFENTGISSGEALVDSSSDAERGSEAGNDEEDGGHEDLEASSEDEEAPVLPREILKRPVDGHIGGSSGKKQRKEKVTKRGSRAVTKSRVTQVDASILKKLEFYKRPKNSNPIKTRTRVWVLHPKYVGKVVAEASAGVNRKSRCVDSANEICKEGQQMISVLRVLYKNTPVTYDPASRFPKHVSYLDQAEGMPNTPVLWCVSHLVEVPHIDQISKLLGELRRPLSEGAVVNDSDFEDSRKRREPKSIVILEKEKRRGRVTNSANTFGQGSKTSRTVLRSANA